MKYTYFKMWDGGENIENILHTDNIFRIMEGIGQNNGEGCSK